MSTIRARRRLAAFALPAGAAVVLAGCSTGSAADPSASPAAEDTTVTIVSGQSAQNGELLAGIVDGYNAQQGRDAVALQMNADSDIDTAQQVLLDLAAGAEIDAVRVTNATYRTLVDAGAAQPADACLAESEHVDELDPDLLAGLAVDGVVYQVPWYVTPAALLYNADLLTAAGLDPDQPPATLEELHEAALAIAATGAGGATAYFGNDYLFQGYVASLGGTVYDPATGELGIDSDAGAEVLDLFAQMAADGSSPVYANFFVDANEAFAGGSLGMMVTAASGYTQFAATAGFDLRIAPAPYFADGEPVTPVSTNGFVITTTDPARQALVCDALLTMLTPEVVTETVQATATIPLIPSVAEAEDGLAPFYAENPSWIPVRQQPLTVWQALPGGAFAEYTGLYADAQLSVLQGGVSPEDAAASLQSGTQTLLEGVEE